MPSFDDDLPVVQLPPSPDDDLPFVQLPDDDLPVVQLEPEAQAGGQQAEEDAGQFWPVHDVDERNDQGSQG